MPQPNSSPKITSTPSVPGQPYDAVDNDSLTPPWKTVTAGPASINNGRQTGDEWPDSDVWRQT